MINILEGSVPLWPNAINLVFYQVRILTGDCQDGVPDQREAVA
jgi:hypothetical protein